MYTRDYIMQMIEQLGQILAQVMFHKKLFDYPRALEEIRIGGTKLLGIDWDFFARSSDKDMIELFRIAASEDTRIYVIAADLLMAEADILLRQGDEDAAWSRRVGAFSLYYETFRIAPTEEIRAKAEESLQAIESFELPPWVEQKRTAFRSDE